MVVDTNICHSCYSPTWTHILSVGRLKSDYPQEGCDLMFTHLALQGNRPLVVMRGRLRPEETSKFSLANTLPSPFDPGRPSHIWRLRFAPAASRSPRAKPAPTAFFSLKGLLSQNLLNLSGPYLHFPWEQQAFSNPVALLTLRFGATLMDGEVLLTVTLKLKLDREASQFQNCSNFFLKDP